MERPTLEALRKERDIYQAHLDKGGESIQLIVELRPWNDAEKGGMECMVRGIVPKPVRALPFTMEFTLFIKEQIANAIQPPG